MTSKQLAFQDQIPGNHCFGCGPSNPQGLQIKSFWQGDDEALCRFLPAAHHCSGPKRYLNGGITSTLMDCHSVCTATAKAYQLAGRHIGRGELITYVTGNMDISYCAPVPIDVEVRVVARITEVYPRKMVVDCDLWSGDTLCATGKVLAVKAPQNW